MRANYAIITYSLDFFDVKYVNNKYALKIVI